MFTRCYAFMYDRISRGSERAGLRDDHAALLAQARGDTVDIGAGTGLNLAPTRRWSRTVPLLLDGMPSEPSHPGSDHTFEDAITHRSCPSWPFAVVRSRRHPVIKRPMVVGRAAPSAG
jgi:hypothetical protein